ncbi:F-box/kelch-repeat protein At3g23880-like isoform X2 [Punica granatum]|uniref:F-box/kelch-repeat protein At3g23880-like isoform X2 n=1 Tax=Punica granatum TaxID=22663 RepID=A0A6P8DE10_PUNGR|nr:F-box/kelch-repeat protein At3g23880-like isoform X2 [Punica granatum]
MEKLSDDILVQILTRIPARSVTQLKLTNKKWCALISHPLFVRAYAEHLRTDMRAVRILKIDRFCLQGASNVGPPQSIVFEVFEGHSFDIEVTNLHDPISHFTPTKIQVAGSCDGLIFFIRHCGMYHVLSLWNPSTKEVRDLPDDLNGTYKFGLSQRVPFGLGIGFDRQMDDYKIVRAACSQNEHGVKETVVDVFTLKTNAWRRIHDNPREKFREVPLPESNANTEFQGIGIIDGCLVIYTVYWKRSGLFEAWAMKEFGGRASWAKLFSISGDRLPTPTKRLQLISLRNGKILLGLDRNEIVLYDIAEGSCQFLLDIGWSDFRYEFIVYVESLISPYPIRGISR